eukprot:Plantae.Rhodophyta-Palmaria_palmata.ctg6351.p1 GENE.Plantae.Rhodophyta-Palmaria_palmata.ctg6351~~Plantae.Rhodophyta-Palmaria_palmata.ctg6351.p1  ORF type:complete len:136 (-),score=15.78 Plantae.Rhodophyta-Palmaria_palmata.ctg6351:517-924(-)
MSFGKLMLDQTTASVHGKKLRKYLMKTLGLSISSERPKQIELMQQNMPMVCQVFKEQESGRIGDIVSIAARVGEMTPMFQAGLSRVLLHGDAERARETAAERVGRQHLDKLSCACCLMACACLRRSRSVRSQILR